MRTFAALTVTGVASVVLFKLFASVVFPLVGVVFGLMAMTVKWALIAAVVFFIWSMIKKRKDANGEVEVG